MIQYRHRYYSFQTNGGTAEVRDGLLDKPGDITDIPLEVLQHVQNLGYHIETTHPSTDIIDADNSSVNDDYEVWI
ncbi:hypothetical protein ACFQH6_15065 [Halobacteriaceae archaeon GCM10025711]